MEAFADKQQSERLEAAPTDQAFGKLVAAKDELQQAAPEVVQISLCAPMATLQEQFDLLEPQDEPMPTANSMPSCKKKRDGKATAKAVKKTKGALSSIR